MIRYLIIFVVVFGFGYTLILAQEAGFLGYLSMFLGLCYSFGPRTRRVP